MDVGCFSLSREGIGKVCMCRDASFDACETAPMAGSRPKSGVERVVPVANEVLRWKRYTMFDPKTRLVQFRDSLIDIRIPDCLVSSESDSVSYFFESNEPQIDTQLVVVVLPLDDPDGFESGQMYFKQQQQLMLQPGFQDTEWLHWEIIRSGSCSILGGVTELVTELTDSRRRTREYCWQVVGINEGHVFHLKARDEGEFVRDEAVWLEVLSSFRLAG